MFRITYFIGISRRNIDMLLVAKVSLQPKEERALPLFPLTGRPVTTKTKNTCIFDSWERYLTFGISANIHLFESIFGLRGTGFLTPNIDIS